jgi:hypothetical protein
MPKINKTNINQTMNEDKTITLTIKDLEFLMMDTYMESSKLTNPMVAAEWIDKKLESKFNIKIITKPYFT